MAPKRPRNEADIPLARALGANVYEFRVMLLPRPGQEAFAAAAGVSPETVRQIEDSRDPERPAKNTSLETVEKLVDGFRKLGLDIQATDLFKSPTGLS
jgi:hypothetical protein